ncbi:Chondroitin synthase [Planctomycetes bacterium Poly30]|uniref:Chondroitin synthase n=1 Tax=Saltatorellus ferox TaxID=2528018 RepID=A0A518EQ12_9BACT|nr:Chondroitin synthase [Planctomycetes bacterium Poly30]
MPPSITASVIIATYNQPRELELALVALLRQSRPPLEVIVGDDGSRVETRNLVQRYAADLPFPLHHVWQEDVGYRKARVMNECARRAQGEQLIFLDGDSFPHPEWVADHLASADGRHVLCGRRVKLGPELSPAVTTDQIMRGSFDSFLTPTLMRSSLAGDTRRLGLGVRLPRPIARLLHPRPRKLMGVNFSLPKSAFVAVNGYNEDWNVYGHEDRDLELRLIRAGIPRKALLNRGIVFHLHHTEREKSEETLRLIREAEESTDVRCARGYDLDVAFDPHG